MGGCMGQWVGSGQMTNLIKLELINIIWFCLKIYNLSRHPYLWVDGWVNGWAHVKPLKSNKSWPNRDNSIMDILDILLDILLKPPQPFIGLFFIFQTWIQVLKWSVADAHPDSQVLSILKFSGLFEICMTGIFYSLKDTLLFKCSEFLILWSFWSSPHQMHIQMIESGIFRNRDQTVYA